MEVVLRVIEGPEKGRAFKFQEADNLLVGRQDPTSQADLNVGPDDEYVSRHHFTLEVRPPNCLIRDYHSANGTFLRRRDQEQWERIEEAQVYDGDHIRIGRTLLAVSIRHSAGPGADAKLGPQPAKLRPARPAVVTAFLSAIKPPLLCLRCGQKPLAHLPELGAATLQAVDFMCVTCQAEVMAERQRETEQKAKTKYACAACRREVTHRANADGLAATLAGAASYLCSDCAAARRELSQPDIGGYQLLKKLGQGGMGVVYKAWHPVTGRLALLKHILPIARSDSDLLLHFMREICLLGTANIRGVVRLYEVGLDDQGPFFASEFVPGGSAAQYVAGEGGPLLSPPKAVRLIANTLTPLALMHAQGYVHRDLKPENILLQPAPAGLPESKLADFGLAYSYEKHGGTITRVGQYAWAIMYMPPEQILSFKQARPSGDVYAMGVVLYYLLTAHYPLDFPNLAELKRGVRLVKDPARMILEDMPRPVGDYRRDLPPRLCAAVDKAVLKDAELRFQSAQEFQAALQSVLRELELPR